MSVKLPIPKQDLMMLRPAGILFVLCSVIAAVSYFSISFFSRSAEQAAANARNLYEQATQSVQQIAQEEATIVRYIGRYRGMETEGVVSEEDRLGFLERVGRIRQANDLFPITIEMGEQTSNPLEYDPNDLSQGDPVALRSTLIDFRMQLLHEGDLMRLLDGMLHDNGLIVPTHCAMSINNIVELDFNQMAEHLMADCTLRLFTYDLDPPVPDAEFF